MALSEVSWHTDRRDVFVIKDKETGFHRGFCWVGYASEEGLQNALQKEPHVIEGSKVHAPKLLSP